MKLKSTRDGFGEALLELAKKDKNIVVVDANLKTSLRVSSFAEYCPERFIEVGVAEQNMIGVAAGLALSGKTVFTTSFACFSPAISWNNVRVSVCYSKANVKIVGSHAGLATGADGASHQALEDVSLMRVLPNMVVLAPADYYQAKALTFLAAKKKGPVYLRLTRPATPIITQKSKVKSQKSKIGGSQILRKGKNLTIVSYGPILSEVLKAAEVLDAEVINCYSLKPVDKKTIVDSARKTNQVLTVEDHLVCGGVGSIVAEVLSQEKRTPLKMMKMIGVQDKFGQSGRDYKELWQKYGLTKKIIVEEGRKMIG